MRRGQIMSDDKLRVYAIRGILCKLNTGNNETTIIMMKMTEDTRTPRRLTKLNNFLNTTK